MDNIIQNNFFERCTGCGACANVCPVQAITIKEDENGFLYPQVDNSKCINCKKCENVCPVNNNVMREKNFNNPKCLAVWANDEIRLKSSSGGVFGAIAQAFLLEGNYVCGAVYKEIDKVEHIVTNKLEDLSQIIGSKYIQSDTKQCYKQIKDILEDGYKVLFCGCPCQVAGLYAAVGENANLYTMDLICHGVPGYRFYRDYLKRYNNPVQMDFRDKSFWGWSTEITITTQDGETIRKRHEEDTFYRGFLPCIVQRKSCEHCVFAILPRFGDLTIGDFWGINSYKKELDDKKGTSVVLVNNEKGELLMNNYNKEFQKIEEVPIEESLRINKNIKQALKPHFSKQRFFRDYNVVADKDKLIEQCRTAHYDVGIVGLWFGLNFGSILTYYALYKVINDLGYSALMINKPKFMWIDRYEDPNTIAQRFIRKYCNVSMVRDEDGLPELSNHCDAFIVGSDVVWNYEICGKTARQFLFLDFVDDSKCKKISYASSLGTGYNAPVEVHALSKYYLQKFDEVSVREQEAADICKSEFDVNAELVMDSVFVCNKEYYYQIAQSTQKIFPNQYIGAYILGPDLQKKEMLQTLKNEYEMPFRIMPNPNADEKISLLQWGDESEILHNGEVEDFLACINNCEYFFADSFHGLCFAIIFHKKFVVVTGKYQKDNCRFRNLLRTIGYENRLVYIEDFVNNKNLLIERMNTDIDYDKVEQILAEKNDKSLNWLKKAISEPKKKKVTIEDYFLSEIKDQKKQIKSIQEENRRLKEALKDSFICNKNYEFLFENNSFSFLQKLAKGVEDKIIFIAACDTIGLSFNAKAQKFFSNIGVNELLVNQHWKGYAAIIDSGKAVFEKLGKEVNESVDVDFEYAGLNIALRSHPLNSGNFSKIIINGEDYSLNKRGMNIVVYDRVLKKVICKSVIDTHSDLFELESFNMIF